MSTFNGQRFLYEQLDSIEMQTYPRWHLYASDDGSEDNTISLLKKRQSRWGRDRLTILSGPRKGFVANFLSMACHPDIEADYFAFSDQDDIWESDKLRRALDCLEDVPKEVPALYCSRTLLVNAQNVEIGLSALFSREPSFENALVQSIAGGNTMVFNVACRELLKKAGRDVDVVSHDWWVYQVVSACGGRVIYDHRPSLRYRQHGGNLIGSNLGWHAIWARIKKLLKGRFSEWVQRNVDALQLFRQQMTAKNKKTFDTFLSSRNQWFLPRVIGILGSRVYRQTTLGNVGLFIAILFKKI